MPQGSNTSLEKEIKKASLLLAHREFLPNIIRAQGQGLNCTAKKCELGVFGSVVCNFTPKNVWHVETRL